MGVTYEMNNEKWVWLLEKSPLLEYSGSAPEIDPWPPTVAVRMVSVCMLGDPTYFAGYDVLSWHSSD